MHLQQLSLTDFRKRLKHLFNVLRKKDVFLCLDCRRQTEYHGTEYGGFAILADSLAPDAQILSCGVGEDASFDLSLIGKYGCRIIGVDPTPKSLNYVHNQLHTDRFSLLQVAVSPVDGQARFYLPRNPDWVSGSLLQGACTGEGYIDVPCLRIGSILKHANFSKLDLLKLDIEGSEYTVLEDYISDRSALRAKQIALEFHHHFPNFGTERTLRLCGQLRRAGYLLAWLSRSHREALFVQS